MTERTINDQKHASTKCCMHQAFCHSVILEFAHASATTIHLSQVAISRFGKASISQCQPTDYSRLHRLLVHDGNVQQLAQLVAPAERSVTVSYL
ncbi:hypothetical protein BaRGS_00007542 [Batillaria attramentaria]|uniref:Uncharacterized protein n=1 Tax=Batillaria attramentaria TaxID=370345 RepID=A0ABD0LPQ6_9CAEN